MKKKLISLISAALCLCMVLSACGGSVNSDPSPSASGSQSGDGTQDKTLTIATMTETTSLSPLYMGVYNYSMCTMLYETLLKYEDGEVKGNLAESYSFNEDGTVMTLTLRQGITFHDGAPFNAEAVKKNLDFMHSNPQYMACPGIYDIESVEATDEYTVTITYPHPYYAYAYDFCWPDVGGMQSPNQIVEGDFQTVQGYVALAPTSMKNMCRVNTPALSATRITGAKHPILMRSSPGTFLTLPPGCRHSRPERSTWFTAAP